MNSFRSRRLLVIFLPMIMTLILPHGIAKAAMITTDQMATSDQASWQRAQVVAYLKRDEVRQSLLDHGVSAEHVSQRLASLTDNEISLLHDKIEEVPAGAGIASLAVTVFVVLIVTDMLCATDIFTFVKCINK